MPGKIIKTTLLLVIILTFLFGKTCSGAPDFFIQYNLEVVDPATHLARIEIHFTGFPEASAKLGLPAYYGGEQLLELENVTARTAKNKLLDVTKEDRSYCVSLGSERDFTVKYDLRMNQKNHGYMGFLCKTYLLSNAGWTFLVPEGQVADEYRVTFKVPTKWSVVTPWKLENKFFIEKDVQKFSKATYGAGELDVHQRNIAGVDYTRIGADYYILLRTKNPAPKKPGLRYYANLDLDSDSVAETQVAAVYGTSGDTSKFRKDWSNYDLQNLGDPNGPESAVSDVIEFKIPAARLSNKKKLAITFGIWDTTNNCALEQTNWLALTFP